MRSCREFLINKIQIEEPGIGILSLGRMGDLGRDPVVDQSLREGGELVDRALAEGFRARHFGILLEDAMKECDLIIPPSGTSGNLIFRTFHHVAGGTSLGAPIVDLDHIFIDTSRSRSDFVDPIILAGRLAAARQIHE